MSLVALAARVCLTKALLGRTIAEERVFDSQISPIDFKTDDECLPVVIVYTDTDTITISHHGMLRPEKREMQVVVELTQAAPSEVEGETGTVVIPQTDAGLEISLDILERQILREMNEPGNAWGHLFLQAISPSPIKVERNRGAGTEKGTRFAARQLIFTVDPISEPDFGEAPDAGTFFADLITAMKADADLAAVGTVLAKAIEGEPLPSWKIVQAQLGLSAQAIRAIGLAPFEDGGDPVTGEPPIQVEATLEDKTAEIDRTVTDGTTEAYEVPPA